MAYTALSAFLGNGKHSSGIILTAVLPGGCNMACPFCIVAKRDERRQQSDIGVAHLNELQSALHRRHLLAGVAVVGDEPLQVECWPTAETFLKAAIDRVVPTALISNGYNLLEFHEPVENLANTRLLISLDAVGEKHDAIRRRIGAFERIRAGLNEAAKSATLRERIAIGAILMPGNLENIAEIIAFTAEAGIPQLLLSPLLTSGRDEPLTVHPKVMREAWRAIPRLLDQANEAGIKLRLSDEFAMLGPWGEKLAATGIEIMAPKEPARLIRVDAAGRVETLATMQAGTTTGLSLPRDPGEIDGLVDRLLEQCFAPVREAA